MCRGFVFPNVKEFQFQLARYQRKTYPGKNLPECTLILRPDSGSRQSHWNCQSLSYFVTPPRAKVSCVSLDHCFQNFFVWYIEIRTHRGLIYIFCMKNMCKGEGVTKVYSTSTCGFSHRSTSPVLMSYLCTKIPGQTYSRQFCFPSCSWSIRISAIQPINSARYLSESFSVLIWLYSEMYL